MIRRGVKDKMVRVEVEARSFLMAMAMNCDDNELEYFLIDHTENTSHARQYLRKLYEGGNFKATNWGPEHNEDELEITIKELGMCYILPKEQTELVTEIPMQQRQQHQHRGKVEATVTSIVGGNVQPTEEVSVVNLDDIPEERTALKGEVTMTSIAGGKAHPTQKVLVNLEEDSTALQGHIRPCYQWSDNATKYLLSEYKERKDLFFNKSLKKATLWKEITQQLTINGFGSPSTAQVEDKFKNLRRAYAKTKDAMGPNASGQPAPAKFKFFEDMEEIFQKNPQFVPPLVVGSRRPRDYSECDSECDSENKQNKQEIKGTPKKSKPNTMERVLEAHNEIIKEIKLSRETFGEKLDKLIEKL